jgi:catechol 2,3-dioxygenase-like lactoylglutathione lyase family enzyme
MDLLGLHHAGIHVSSLERSLAFYTDVFELTPGPRLRLGSERLAFLRCGRGQIELIEDGDTGRKDERVQSTISPLP